jgi:hypothetical protein
MEKTFGYRINEIAKLWRDNNILENQKVKVKNTQANGKPWLLGSIYYLGATCPQFDVLLDDGTFKTIQFADKGKTWDLWEPVKVWEKVEVKYVIGVTNEPYGDWQEPCIVDHVLENSFIPFDLFERFYVDEDLTWRRIPKAQVKGRVERDGGDESAWASLKEWDYSSGWASQGNVVCKKLNDEIHGLQILARKDSADIEKLTARVDDYKRANASLEEGLNHQQAENTSLQHQIDRLIEQEWKARNQATVAEQEVVNLTNQCLARESELQAKRNQIGHLRNVIEQKERIVCSYEVYRDQIHAALKTAGYDYTSIWNTTLDIIKNFEASGAGDKNQIVSLQGVINSKECLIDSYVVYRDQIDAALKAAGYDTTTSIWNTTLDIIKNNPNKPKEEPKEYKPLKPGDKVSLWPSDIEGNPVLTGQHSWETNLTETISPLYTQLDSQGFKITGWDFRYYKDENKTWRRVIEPLCKPLRAGDLVQCFPVDYDGKPRNNDFHQWGPTQTIEGRHLGTLGFKLDNYDIRHYSDENKTWRRVALTSTP